MYNFSELNNFINHKNKMLYTFIFYKLTIEEITNYLINLIDKVKLIKDTYKRKIANDRIYSIKNYFDLLDQDNQLQINGVFLVDNNNKSFGFKLDNNHINILINFKIPYSQYFCEDYYNINYIYKLVSTNDLVHVLSIEGVNGKLIQIDSVKNKHFDVTTNIDDLIINNNIELIFGNISSSLSQLLTKKYTNKQFYSGKLSNDEIWSVINKNKNEKMQIKLNDEVLSKLTHPDKIDLFVYGRKNVRESILLYSIKKIFVSSEIYVKYKKNISSEFFNFEINIVDKISSGDYGDILVRDFDGVIGIKYF